MKRIAKTAMLTGALALACCSLALAQDKKSTKTSKPAAQDKKKDGYTTLPSGLEYKIVKHGKGTAKPVLTDHVEINISVLMGDSVVFDSRKMNDNKPVPVQIQPRYKGDPLEAVMMMVVGDSALLRMPVDSLKKMGMAQPWMKEGSMLTYRVTLNSLKSDAQMKKEMTENADKQKVIDDKILQDYFAKNNIKPLKTASGLYYTISREGTGIQPKEGYDVSVNYTGMFLNGNKFDSNVDTAFHHVQPFNLQVGKGQVIKGWDEGLMLLKKGTRATFYIPSHLAYGPQERNPIPANSILLFDVELTDVQAPSSQVDKDDRLIQDYLKNNNVQATKTASGLYYRIIREGSGETAKPGQKATMKYLGTTLDGHVFDGNMDENFEMKGGKATFQFTVGVGQVIKGWDEGIQLLKKGSRATLYLPSGIAYGSRGAGGAIPPNAVLIFNVEVVDLEQ